MPFVLAIAEGKGRGQRYQFEGERITIGRDAGNDVVLNDAGVSRDHARIERQEGRWVLLDAGSANGTELNGALLEGPSRLRPGDRIGVGPVTFEFSAPADRADTLVTAPPVPEQGMPISSAPAGPLEPRPGRGRVAAAWARLPLPAKVAVAGGAVLLLIGVGRAAVRSGEEDAPSGPEAPPAPAAGEAPALALPQDALLAGDLAAARRAWERGRRKLEERRVAPRNLYDAWKAFVEARRQMEGLAQKPPLYAEVSKLIQDAERDLGKECGKLLFTAARFERYGQDQRAQQAYREVLLHFPAEDPAGCRKKAQANLVSTQAAGEGGE